MTSMDVAGPANVSPTDGAPAPHPHSVADAGRARFYGRDGTFFAVLARGAVYLVLTLGIYRFWLSTELRRFLWGQTEIAGDTLEYTGTPRELLIGFLMALALLTPIYVLFAIAALELGAISMLSGALSFLLLVLLGQFAVFRARRYRLTRTVFRGVRLYQSGSAWGYALLSMLWWGLSLLTLGLAHPWGLAALERYKMRRTHYGTLNGKFLGSGTRLFFRGLLMWLLVMGPLAIALVFGLGAIDWDQVQTTLGQEGDFGGQLLGLAAEVFEPLMVTLAGIGFALLMALLLYPIYRALVVRWWISGMRLGPMQATSRLRTGQVYRIHLRFLGYALLFALVAGLLSGVALAVFGLLSDSFGSSLASEVGASLVGVGTYVFVMLGYSTVYQATVTIRFWRLGFETTDVTGLAALDAVEARGAAGSPFGEGLADALDVGGI